MSSDETALLRGHPDELAALIQRLQETEQRIAEITAGQVDAVLTSSGKPHLLQSAQQSLHRREVEQRELASVQTAVLNAMPAHIALLDSQANIVAVNEAWRRFAQGNGFAGDASGLGDNYLDACRDSPDVMQGIRDVLSGERPRFAMEYPCHAPGEKRWFRLITTPVVEADRQGALVMHVDITDLHQALRRLVRGEKRIARSEERFRLVARASSDAIWDWDVKRDRLWRCGGLGDRSGGGGDELESSLADWVDRVHPEDKARLTAGLERTVHGNALTWKDEYRFILTTGHEVRLKWRGYVMRDANGVAYRVVGGTTDVTRERAADQRLAEQAALLDEARDAILVRKLDHTVAFWNRSAERLYGWTASEAMGRSVAVLLYDEPTAFLSATEQVLAHGEWSGELSQICKDGSKVVVEGRWTLVCDDNGIPDRILVINTDMTEKKALLAQFLRAQRMEGIGALAGGIAHDLNNVLAPILLSIGLLRQQASDDKTLETLSDIEAAAQRGADMVRQILTYARGSERVYGAIDVDRSVVEIEKIIRDSFPKNIVFVHESGSDIWQIDGDSTELHQVLLNLCVNARDAMPQGGMLRITLENFYIDANYAAMIGSLTQGRHVRISVTDTGMGMPAKVMRQIFDPFYTTKAVGSGTGLGLATVESIVRSHAGTISVESKPGAGTTFNVFLPASASARVEPDMAEERALARGCDELILVVDDESAIRSVTQQTLEAFGYRVITAENGADAIAIFALRKDEIAVVLTDMTMPIMDGPTTIRVLRRMDPELIVIATSGSAKAGERVNVAGLGADHFLAKPFTTQALLDMLELILAKRR
ncbi:MAG: PAS domain S-box protein [Bradymonadaceae bacterium]|nr:PAS domain S-box protein [Lujinxingiaceae bacterium]